MFTLFKTWRARLAPSGGSEAEGRSPNWTLAQLSIVDQCVVSGSNFLVSLFLARRLGISQFGLFTLGMMAIWFFQSAQNALVLSPMLSISPKIPAETRPTYFGAVISHQIIMIGVAIAIFMLSAAVVALIYPANPVSDLLASVAAGSAGLSMQDFARRYFYATARPRLAVRTSILGNGLQLAGLVGATLLWPLTIHSAFLVIAGAATIAAAISTAQFERVRFERQRLVEVTTRHWHVAKWLLASTLAFWVSGNLYYFVAGALLGPVAVGAMRAAGLILAVGNVIVLGIENYLPAIFVAAWRQAGIKAAGLHTLKLAAAAFAAMTLIAAIACAAPSFWFHLFFGEQYVGYDWLIYAFAVHYLLTLVSNVGASVLLALERTRTIFIVQFATAIFSLLTAISLIRLGGLAGAAAGIVIVDFLGAALTVFGLAQVLRSGLPTYNIASAKPLTGWQ